MLSKVVALVKIYNFAEHHNAEKPPSSKNVLSFFAVSPPYHLLSVDFLYIQARHSKSAFKLIVSCLRYPQTMIVVERV